MSNSYFFSDINFNFATLSKFVLAFYGSKAYCPYKILIVVRFPKWWAQIFNRCFKIPLEMLRL